MNQIKNSELIRDKIYDEADYICSALSIGSNWQKITIIVLAIALFSVIQYFLLERWQETKNNEIINSYKAGYNRAYQEIITTLFKNTERCKIATLHADNLTKQLVDMKCTNQK